MCISYNSGIKKAGIKKAGIKKELIILKIYKYTERERKNES
jgi:hypothetical protein